MNTCLVLCIPWHVFYNFCYLFSLWKKKPINMRLRFKRLALVILRLMHNWLFLPKTYNIPSCNYSGYTKYLKSCSFKDAMLYWFEVCFNTFQVVASFRLTWVNSNWHQIESLNLYVDFSWVLYACLHVGVCVFLSEYSWILL